MNANERILFNVIFGEGYQEDLPDLPTNPPDGHYFWRRATQDDRVSFADRQGTRWVVSFEWDWEKQ